MKDARTPNVRSLKLTCLVLFCALAGTIVFSRFKADAGNAQPVSVSLSATQTSENRPPEMDDIRIKRVGLGQHIFFGISVIDEETDDIRVEMTEKPASAKYNEKTLTVDWTPRKSDGKMGAFAVRITEYPRGGGSPRTYVKTFNIEIADRP